MAVVKPSSVLYLQPGYPDPLLQVSRNETLGEVRRKLPKTIRNEGVIFLKLEEEEGYVKGVEMVLPGEEGKTMVGDCSSGDILIEREADCKYRTPKCLVCGEYTKGWGALVAEWKTVNFSKTVISSKGSGSNLCWSWKIDKLQIDMRVSAEQGMVFVPKIYRCVKVGCSNRDRFVNMEGTGALLALKK